MASLITLASLLVQATKAELYQKALDVAVAVGLPVTSWQAGDPTRSLYHFQSEVLSTLEGVAVEYISAGFLDFAVERAKETGDSTWLKLLAKQVFGVDVIEATFASTACTLTNASGSVYVIEPGDLTAKNTSTGKTYHNTTGGTLSSGPGATLSLTFEADEAGSDSSAGASEIDDLVTTLLGVTITNPTAAVGIDEEAPDAVAVRCRAAPASVSPNGPRDAYVYVALKPELTGTTAVTRARSFGDSNTGIVTVYLAGPSGAISSADRALVETAILKYATPLCITPVVLSAVNLVIAPTYQLWLYSSVGKTTQEVKDAVEEALQEMFLARPIGGDVIGSDPGRVYHSMIESTIRGVFPDHCFRVSLTTPAGDTDLLASNVAVLGAITATITFVEPQ